jgi:Zn-dependent peptidase ImmA (M78 family)
MRKKYCGAEAARLLRDAGIRSPPVDVRRVANALLVHVRPVGPWDPRWRARAKLRREVPEIIYNPQESRRAVRFSIAHELGHFLLHESLETFSEFEDPESPEYSADPRKELENEANYFASVLLVPPEWLRTDVKQGASVEELVERYDVSRDVMFIALREHRLVEKLK